MPPVISVAMLQTPTHDGLLTVPWNRTTRVTILFPGELAAIDAAKSRKEIVRNDRRANSPTVK
jgi:hypothetical protein